MVAVVPWPRGKAGEIKEAPADRGQDATPPDPPRGGSGRRAQGTGHRAKGKKFKMRNMKNLFGLIGKNIELKKSNDHLRTQNLRLRLEMDILIDDPDGRAARLIRERIRNKRREIDESLKAVQS